MRHICSNLICTIEVQEEANYVKESKIEIFNLSDAIIVVGFNLQKRNKLVK